MNGQAMSNDFRRSMRSAFYQTGDPPVTIGCTGASPQGASALPLDQDAGLTVQPVFENHTTEAVDIEYEIRVGSVSLGTFVFGVPSLGEPINEVHDLTVPAGALPEGEHTVTINQLVPDAQTAECGPIIVGDPDVQPTEDSTNGGTSGGGGSGLGKAAAGAALVGILFAQGGG